MNNKNELIYEGKAKKVFSHDDEDKVIIEFKDDATAFNSLKKAKFEGKGKLNCQISTRIFELLVKNNILLGDEISPDNCRLWELNQQNDTIVSLDKDRFRNDLGGLIEAYSEIHRRINDFI